MDRRLVVFLSMSLAASSCALEASLKECEAEIEEVSQSITGIHEKIRADESANSGSRSAFDTYNTELEGRKTMCLSARDEVTREVETCRADYELCTRNISTGCAPYQQSLTQRCLELLAVVDRDGQGAIAAIRTECVTPERFAEGEKKYERLRYRCDNPTPTNADFSTGGYIPFNASAGSRGTGRSYGTSGSGWGSYVPFNPSATGTKCYTLYCNR